MLKAVDAVLRLTTDKPALAIAYNEQGLALLASADGDGVILVHDAETGKLLLRLRETPGTIFGLSFRGDGKVLAAAGRDGVFLWDVTPGNEGEILTAGRAPQ